MNVPSSQRNTEAIVLASQSPRRQELLQEWGIQYHCVPSGVEEPERINGEPLGDYVQRVSLLKARHVAPSYPECLVLGADTIVAIGETILGKPLDDAQAVEFLQMLSGTRHQVCTGVAFYCHAEGWSYVDHSVTEVVFKHLTQLEIMDYVASGEPRDKAGAYAIQGRASQFVIGVEGAWDNVVGLPRECVMRGLEAFGKRQ